MTALWIVLGVLAALVVLSLIPLRVRAEYGQELRVWFCILCFRLKLLPRKEKPKKPKQEKPKKEKKEKKPKKEKPKPKLKPSTLLDYARLGLELLGSLRRKICIYELTLHAAFGGADEAEATLNYGRAWAAIGAVTPLLERTFRIKKRDLAAQFEPQRKEIKLFARAEAGITLAQILALALHALRGWLKIRKDDKTEEVAQKHDKSDQ